MYFRCRNKQYSEDTIDPTSIFNPAHEIFSMSSLLPMKAALKYPSADYDAMLTHYNERALSNPGDALLAMQGISRRVAQLLNCSFFQGCPTATFDAFIAFQGDGTILRRRTQFPSYTWAGWIGRVLGRTGAFDVLGMIDEVNLNAWLRDGTWIRYHKRYPSGAIKPIWDNSEGDDFAMPKNQFGWRHPPGIGHRVRVKSTVTAPTEDLIFLTELPSYPLLQFWTVSVYLKILHFDVFDATAHIVVGGDDKRGELKMDGFGDDEFFQPGQIYEFILVSERFELSRAECNCENAHGWTEQALRRPKPVSRAFNVLVLEWKGGLAERRGMGVLCGSAVERSLLPGMSWKEIVLQ